VDKIGKRIFLVVFGHLILLAGLFILAWQTINPLIAIVSIGISYSLVPAALWPCLPIIIDEQYIGTAFGLMSCIVNLGGAASYYVQGFVADVLGSGIYQLIFYAGLALFGCLMSIIWLVIDYREGGRCMATTKAVPDKSIDIN